MRQPQNGERVLWIRFEAFGDTLEAAADAKNFKDRFPGIRLSFLTKEAYADLLRKQPYIDQVLTGNKKPFFEWLRILKKIRDGRYRWFVCEHAGGHMSWIALFSGIPYRICRRSALFAFNYGAVQEECFPAWGLDVHNRDRPALFAAPEDSAAASPILSALPPRKLFALIGAGRPHKLWPAARWIDFLAPLLDEGWGVVLNGHGDSEKAFARQIAEALANPMVLDLTGKLNFSMMAAVALRCTAAVGNDTGPLHLAALGGVPTLGLFGRSTSWKVHFRMPWFRELSAEDWARSEGKECPDPLALLPSEIVLREFRKLELSREKA